MAKKTVASIQKGEDVLTARSSSWRDLPKQALMYSKRKWCLTMQ